MISHVGLLPRLSQSEWIWNRVILARHQSPVIQSFSLQSRSPKELELQDRFLHIAMRKSLDDGSSNVVAERNIARGIFQLDFEKLCNFVTFLGTSQVLSTFPVLLSVILLEIRFVF